MEEEKIKSPEEAAPVPTEPAAPDLEALRDEKVVPVARGVLTDMAGEIAATDINAATDLTSVIIKILKRGLAADLNVTTENPYVFQLVLGAYAAFSGTIQKCKVTDTPDARYGKIGGELLTLLANANVPMGTKVIKQEQEAATDALQSQIEDIFARENLTWLEVKYILEGLFRSLKSIEQVYSSNIELSVKRMEAKILGLGDMTDLSMAKLDEMLQKDFSQAEEQKA